MLGKKKILGTKPWLKARIAWHIIDSLHQQISYGFHIH
jgi:hypothetical protein